MKYFLEDGMKKRSVARKASVALRHALLKHRKKKLLMEQIRKQQDKYWRAESDINFLSGFMHEARLKSRIGPPIDSLGGKRISRKAYRKNTIAIGGTAADIASVSQINLNKIGKTLERKKRQLQTLRFSGKKKK